MQREDPVLTSIKNKSVIVTGGTKGIGKGIAGVFVQLGARVCVTGRKEPDGAATVEALRDRGGTAMFCRGDVKEQEDMEEATATVATAFGGVDILCKSLLPALARPNQVARWQPDSMPANWRDFTPALGFASCHPRCLFDYLVHSPGCLMCLLNQS